jgi:ubiquinone/menaquinone biosynthesis C-methylase UbiE
MGRITRRKFDGARMRPRLVNGRVQRLPFAAQAFDAIVCTFPTNFIMDPHTIEETYRVLKPGARLVFVPGSVFIRRGAAETTLEALYRVTGQRGAANADWSAEYRRAYEAQGFRLSEAIEPCKRSAAIVIIAEKPAS